MDHFSKQSAVIQFARWLVVLVGLLAPVSAWAGFDAPFEVSTAHEWTGNESSAIDPNGNVIFVWLEPSPALISRRAVRTRFRFADGRWGALGVISAPRDSVLDVRVAVDGRGNALVVWAAAPYGLPPRSIIRSRFRTVTGAFGPSQTLSDPNAISRYPQVAFDASGRALVVWQQGGDVYARSRSAGGLLGRIQRLGSGYSPDLALAPSGRALVVWAADSFNFDGHVDMASRSSPTVVFDSPILDVFSNLDQRAYPHAAMDANGNAIIVAGDGRGTYTRTRSASGVLGPRLTLDTYGCCETPSRDREAVAATPAGKVLVGWTIWGGERHASYGSITGGLGPVITLDVSRAKQKVALRPGGEGLIAWSSYDNSTDSYRIRAVTVSPDGVFANVETILNPPHGHYAFVADADVNAQGQAVIAWLHNYATSPRSIYQTEAATGTVP